MSPTPEPMVTLSCGNLFGVDAGAKYTFELRLPNGFEVRDRGRGRAHRPDVLSGASCKKASWEERPRGEPRAVAGGCAITPRHAGNGRQAATIRRN